MMALADDEWEVRREQATKSWKAMTPHQQQCVLDMLASHDKPDRRPRNEPCVRLTTMT